MIITKYPSNNPAIAKPFPETLSGFALILDDAICPKITATIEGIAKKNQAEVSPIIPNIKLKIAVVDVS